MKIAVLSGKGGTGKTLLSVNLAAAAGEAVYIDCDVEEPNGHLFFRPDWEMEAEVTTRVPEIDPNACTGCRRCVNFCRFNALAYAGDRVMLFEPVCHSCGGCALVCPEKAISERPRVIGKMQKGRSEGVKVYSGRMNPGEVSGIPIMERILKIAGAERSPLEIIDCPPGSACAAMESIRDADFCLLVAEPTRFGASNLEMVHELVTTFKKPAAVVLNKVMEGENPSRDYCEAHELPILAEIPWDPELGHMAAEGRIAVREDPGYAAQFTKILVKLGEEVGA